jgi:hypothetical protein
MTLVLIRRVSVVPGLVCIEMFLVGKEGQQKVLVNELAPRPHNSGAPFRFAPSPPLLREAQRVSRVAWCG